MSIKAGPEEMQASLLDRLSDDRPYESREVDRGWDFRRLRQALVRDLESLLNSRQTSIDSIGEFKEVKGSLLTYGLPDISNLNPKSPSDIRALQRLFEQSIRQFEPRLTRVKIEWMESTSAVSSLHFRVHAFMRTHPKPMAITFDTRVQTSNKSVDVKDA
jgi:type VI secretion system protein ImpF